MKTPLQQFINAIKNRELKVEFSTKNGIYIEGDVDKYIEMEKESIIKAHSSGIKFMAGNTQLNQDVSIKYYNDNFTTSKTEK